VTGKSIAIISGAVVLAGGVGYVVYSRHKPAPIESPAAVGEALDLESHGIEVVQPETVEDLEKLVAELAAQNQALADALAKVRAEAPKTKIVSVECASTGPVESKEPGIVAGEIRVTSVQLQTEAGNKILIGTAEAWRLDPGPAALLFGGPFSAKATEVSGWPGDLIRPSKWGIGPAVFYAGGFRPGLVLAAPPFRVLGLEFSPLVGVGWGAGLAAIVVRP
jgi:hypothetical protein